MECSGPTGDSLAAKDIAKFSLENLEKDLDKTLQRLSAVVGCCGRRL